MHRRSNPLAARGLPRAGVLLTLLFGTVLSHAARPRELTLRRVVLDLPGPPAIVVAADLNRDGRQDLLVVTAYTHWGSISTDRVEEAVEVTRSEEHTSELQSLRHLVCRLLLEKTKHI